MRRIDAIGLAVVAASLAALLAYRHVFIEPREWGALCAAAAPPAGVLPRACAPRAALLWLQHFQLWGAGALVLGLWAFIGAPFVVGVAGVAVGLAGVVNYNATWGMLGLALASWAWVRSLPPPATA